MDAQKHKYHMLSDINEQPFPLNLLADIGLSSQFPDMKQCTPDARKGLAAALSTLEEREELAILLRYRHGYKLDDIAEQLDLTRERVRQIIRDSVSKLNQPFTRSLIECGFVGYIEKQAEAKSDEIVRERLSNEYRRGYETGMHDAALKKEMSCVFDLSDIDISTLTFSNELEKVGIESWRDLIFPIAKSNIDVALREQVRHCYLSREAYQEVVDFLNENGMEIQFDEDLKPNLTYLPDFFSCTTTDDIEQPCDKEHQLALNYASWMLPYHIDIKTLSPFFHKDDTKYFVEIGKYTVKPSRFFDGEVIFHEQKTVYEHEIFPYNLLHTLFADNIDAIYVFPDAENCLNALIDEALSSLNTYEEKIIRLSYQFNFKEMDFSHLISICNHETLNWGMRRKFQQIEQKALRKLRHPSRAKMLRPFLVNNPVKICDSLKVYDSDICIFANTEKVVQITQITDSAVNLLQQNPSCTLNDLRMAFLKGLSIHENAITCLSDISTIFPNIFSAFSLLADTATGKRNWYQWNSNWLANPSIKKTISALGSMTVNSIFFSQCENGSGLSRCYSYLDDHDNRIMVEKLDRMLLIETSSNEKKLFCWPRNSSLHPGEGNVNLVEYAIPADILDTIFSMVKHQNLDENRDELREQLADAEFELRQHYETFPDAFLQDTIMYTRQWGAWPNNLVCKDFMEIPPFEFVTKAYCGIWIGKHGDIQSDGAITRPLLLIETDLHTKKLFLLGGIPENYNISEEFLDILFRLVERGQRISVDEKTALQRAICEIQYDFCLLGLGYPLASREVSIFENHKALLESQLSILKKPIYNKLTPIEKLDFSVRTYNSLIRANIFTLGQIVSGSQEDLLRMGRLGKKSLDEIEKKLQEFGLTLENSCR